jgi:hypothetical protein
MGDQRERDGGQLGSESPDPLYSTLSNRRNSHAFIMLSISIELIVSRGGCRKQTVCILSLSC